MPVGEDGHPVGAAGELLLCLGGRAPVGLAVEGRDVVVAVRGRVRHQTLHGVPEVLDLFAGHGADVTAQVLLAAVVVVVNCWWGGQCTEWLD